MSTTAAPPPRISTPTSIPNGARASPSSARSPQPSINGNGGPSTPRSVNNGFGQNAVAGPSRPSPSPGTTNTPTFPPGGFAGNGSTPNGTGTGITFPNGLPRSQPTADASNVQARLMLAHQAIQANMLQHHQQQNDQHMGPGASPNRGSGGMGIGTGDGMQARERRMSAGVAGPDLSTMANAMGMLQGMQGSNKEAMMKQALTTSRVQRDRQNSTTSSQLQTPSQPNLPLSSSPSATTTQTQPQAPTPTSAYTPIPQSPHNPQSTHPLPAVAAPSPAAPSPANSSQSQPPQIQNRPSHRPSFNLGAIPNGLQKQMQFPTEAEIRAATAHLTSEQRDAFVSQHRARMLAFQQAAQAQNQGQAQGQGRPSSSGMGQVGQNAPSDFGSVPNGVTQAPTPTAQAQTPVPGNNNPGQNGMQPSAAATSAALTAAMGPQRKQFIQSLLSYHKQMNLTPPAEILNGPLPGQLQMGSYIVELVDLFMTIMRQAGGNAGLMKNGEPHPVFSNYVLTHSFPNPLPAPVKVPKPEGSTLPIPDETDDSVKFLFMVYVTYLQGFEHHMMRQRSMMQTQRMQQAQQQQQQAAQNGQGQAQGQAQGQGQGQGMSQGLGQQGQQTQQGQQGQIQAQLPAQLPQPPPSTQQIQIPQLSQPQSQPPSQSQHPYQSQITHLQQQSYNPQYPQPPMANSTPYQPPTPTGFAQPGTPSNMTAPSPIPSHFNNGTGAPSPHTFLPHLANSPITHAPSPPAPAPAPAPVVPKARAPKARKDGKAGPAPIRSDGLTGVSGSISSPTVPTPTSATTKKRKKTKKELAAEKLAEKLAAESATTTTPTSAFAATPISAPVRPPTPKRARYKVEYRPLHHPVANMCGWDERAVSSTFPKNNLSQPSRSIHELGIVDMDSILMGLRSRMKREVGYGLTVLNMLSMPHPEDGVMGLPIVRLQDIYLELLDMLEELALGDEGLEGFKELKAGLGKGGDGEIGGDKSKMGFLELEQLGKDLDWSVPDTPQAPPRRPDHTGGNTDIILSILNLLRNFSLWGENQPVMASHPALFHTLAAISDISLARLPGGSGTEPYSILELGRVRRDAVSILSNLGPFVDLRIVEPWSILAVHRLLSSFLSSAWSAISSKESPFTAYTPARESPIPIIHSVNRALETWCKLAQADSNREILSRCIPSLELVDLYSALVKLLPLTLRQQETLLFDESYLGMTECLALSLHSLAFLAPQSTRAAMRHVPGALDVILRLIHTTSTAINPPPQTAFAPSIDPRNNTFHVLCRRLAETLGVLNGTVSCAADGMERMSFSAGAASETGWSFSNRPVERGWLAGREEAVCGTVGRNGVDAIVRQELDGMWYVGTE